MMQVVIAACRHLPSRYREHTDADLMLQRQRIVLALEPQKSQLERDIVRASVQQDVWDLTLDPADERIRRLQQQHRKILARHVEPEYVCCLTSTWIRAANTAGLLSQAIAEDYALGPIMPCRLLDSSQYRDLSALALYADLHTAYVQTHGVPPEDVAFLQGTLTVSSSFYETWQNGKRLVLQLCDDPIGTLQSYGYPLPASVRTLLVMAYSHKEVWEQIVTDAYPVSDYHFDGSLYPGELMLLTPDGPHSVRLHLPESTLPPASLPRDYFRT